MALLVVCARNPRTPHVERADCSRPKTVDMCESCLTNVATLETDDMVNLCPSCYQVAIAETRAAAILGRKGGRSKSEAKAAAARENGKKGGRRVNK
jgi:hypothetical protein